MRVLSLLVIFLQVFVTCVWYAEAAQTQGLATAEYLPVTGEIRHGSIIEIGSPDFRLSSGPYAERLYGVVTLNPAIAIALNGKENKVAVVSVGGAEILVSGENGPIKPGDFITSSSQPGVGMKATQSGNVFAVAQTEFVGTTKETTGIVQGLIDRRYVEVTHRSFAGMDGGGDTIFGGSSAASQWRGFSLIRVLLAVAVAGISFLGAHRALAEPKMETNVERSQIVNTLYKPVFALLLAGAGFVGSVLILIW